MAKNIIEMKTLISANSDYWVSLDASKKL